MNPRPLLTRAVIGVSLLILLSMFTSMPSTDETSTIATNYLSAKRLNLNSANSTTIHVYGGSISLGNYKGIQRYSDLLEGYLSENGISNNAIISNFAIGASGPERWLLCGIGYADIIISEFRMNEQTEATLDKWYELAMNSSRHLIVLDLWTWLEPPSHRMAVTSKAAMKFVDKDPDSAGSRASNFFLDGFPDTWRELIPLYYDYTQDEIPSTCYHASLERDGLEKGVIQNCRINHGNHMQHGTQIYHYEIANQMASHMKEVVFPRLVFTSKEKNSNQRSRGLCIGQWGDKHLYSSGWDESLTIRNISGFSVGSPLSGRNDKVTVYTNSTDAHLMLVCPAPYTSASIGYIAHTDFEESGIIKLNDVTVNTWISDPYLSAHIRVRKFSPKLTSPLRVSVGSLESLAYIELAELACQ